MFFKKLKSLSKVKKSSLCVGLDDPNEEGRLERVCKIIDQTEPYTICYKINPAFSHGDIRFITDVAAYLKKKGLLWIYDGKLGDVPHTNTEYAKYVYDVLGADAMTANPYCGFDALTYLMRESKGLFVLAKTTNPYARAVQDPISDTVLSWGEKNTEFGFVVAGNKEGVLADARSKLPTSWFLTPGIGAQGGKIRRPQLNTLYSVSRSVINADDPGLEAKRFAELSYFDLMAHLEHRGMVKRGKFTLSSGQESDLYIDLRELTSHLDLFNHVVYELADLITDSSNIMGVASAGVPLASALGVLLNRPFGYVRSKPKGHGTQGLVEGGVSLSLPVAVIDDVVTSGGSLIKAILALREQGYVVNQAFCVVDRGMGGSEALKAIGVNLKSLVSL